MSAWSAASGRAEAERDGQRRQRWRPGPSSGRAGVGALSARGRELPKPVSGCARPGLLREEGEWGRRGCLWFRSRRKGLPRKGGSARGISRFRPAALWGVSGRWLLSCSGVTGIVVWEGMRLACVNKIKVCCVFFINIYRARNQSFVFANLVLDSSEMSSKSKSHPAENGEHPRSKMENGTDSTAASALSTYTPEEMVQQMKELITENNELKGACMWNWSWNTKALWGEFCPMSMIPVLICPSWMAFYTGVAFTVQETLQVARPLR